VLVTTLQGCASADDPAACKSGAREAFMTCKAPCMATLKESRTVCKADAKSCMQGCKGGES